MRILLIYPGHRYSTFDVANGYETGLNELDCDVRVLDYHNRLSFYENALQLNAAKDEEFHRRGADSLVLASESVILEAVEYAPDVVLVISGMALHRNAFELLHQLQLPVFLLATESPYLDKWQALIANKGYVAGILTNDKYSVSVLHEETDLPVVYLPHSYDPRIHRPKTVSEDYQSDLLFVGTLWPERQELFEPLVEHIENQNGDSPVLFIGGIDPAIIKEEPESVEYVDNTDLALLYSGTRIALNQHRTVIEGGDDGPKHIDPSNAYSVGPRAFEIAACGAFQLSDSRPELLDIFGDSVGVYTGSDDLIQKVDYYLANDKERQEMADAARTRIQGCTFEARARDILLPFLEKEI